MDIISKGQTKFGFILGLAFLTLGSCCDQSFNSSSGFTLLFSDSLTIEKIKIEEINKTITVYASVANLTLNPSDSISTFTIYYQGGSGTIKLGHSSTFSYEKSNCNNALRKVYEVHVKSHTFKQVDLNPHYNKVAYIEITR